MAKTELVPITAHVPRWVRDAFRRCAHQQGRTVSSIAAQILEEDCADDPENPKNQPNTVRQSVAGESTVGEHRGRPEEKAHPWQRLVVLNQTSGHAIS
jgi:hypothetical protein